METLCNKTKKFNIYVPQVFIAVGIYLYQKEPYQHLQAFISHSSAQTVRQTSPESDLLQSASAWSETFQCLTKKLEKHHRM